MKKKYTLDYNI